MKYRRIPFALWLVALAAPGLVAASTQILEVDADCEAALALSAGPVYLREAAGVYVLGANGYELLRESRNGFICMVERNHPESLIPQCFDPRARQAHVALLLDEGKLIRQGMSFEHIAERRSAALADGSYPAPEGPGLAYMISDYNYILGTQGDVVKVAPHMMYHAPGLSHADIGSDPRQALANRGLPIIASEGPHGFMIGFTESASDSSEVEAACEGQLPDPDRYRPFPDWAQIRGESP